jgi:putative aminopeptidase FrvX
MSNLPEINTQFLLDFLTELLNTPSPTGYSEPAISLCEEMLKAFPALKLARTRKGALTATWRGDQDEGPHAPSRRMWTRWAGWLRRSRPTGG